MIDLEPYRKRYEFTGDLKGALYFTGDWHDYEAERQPAFAIAHGLLPTHDFLDLGCGCLRGTAPLVDYLDPNRFWGADISEGLLREAVNRCKSLGVVNAPNLVHIKSYDFGRVFGNKKFDFILSVSVLTHMLPYDVPELFEAVRTILKPEGVWYFTMYPTCESPGEGDIEVARQNKEWLINVGKQVFLDVEDVDEGIRKNDCPGTSSLYCPEVNSTLGQWVMKASLL